MLFSLCRLCVYGQNLLPTAKDFDYLVLGTKSGTLSPQEIRKKTYNNNVVYYQDFTLINIRTGEILGKLNNSLFNKHDKNNNVIISKEANAKDGGDLLFGYNSDLNLLYTTEATFQNSPVKVTFNDTFTKVFFVYNSDLWEADFNSKTGDINNHNQLTFARLYSGVDVWIENINGQVLFHFNKFSKRLNLYNFITHTHTSLFDVESPITPRSNYILQKKKAPDDTEVYEIIDINTFDKYIPLKDVKYLIFESKTPKYLYINDDFQFFTASFINNAWEYSPTDLTDADSQISFEDYECSPSYTSVLKYLQKGSEKKVIAHLINQNQSFDLQIDFKDKSEFFSGFSWIDDDSFVFDVLPGYEINGKLISNETQGSYLGVLSSKKLIRISPEIKMRKKESKYYSANMYDTVFNLNNTPHFVLVRNGVVYLSRKDGTESQKIEFKSGSYHLYDTLIWKYFRFSAYDH